MDEWMDGCGAASGDTRACESPCARVYAALRLRNTQPNVCALLITDYITMYLGYSLLLLVTG